MVVVVGLFVTTTAGYDQGEGDRENDTGNPREGSGFGELLVGGRLLRHAN